MFKTIVKLFSPKPYTIAEVSTAVSTARLVSEKLGLTFVETEVLLLLASDVRPTPVSELANAISHISEKGITRTLYKLADLKYVKTKDLYTSTFFVVTDEALDKIKRVLDSVN